MTKKFPMASVQVVPSATTAVLSFGLYHSFVIHGLLLVIRMYRWTISPAQVFLFGPTAGCRFTPTCSQYAMDAIREHGALAGGWMGLKRICRCHPCARCGHDPVPGKEFGVRSSEFGIIPEQTP
jgi:hypothetical protein